MIPFKQAYSTIGKRVVLWMDDGERFSGLVDHVELDPVDDEPILRLSTSFGLFMLRIAEIQRIVVKDE